MVSHARPLKRLVTLSNLRLENMSAKNVLSGGSPSSGLYYFLFYFENGFEADSSDEERYRYLIGYLCGLRLSSIIKSLLIKVRCMKKQDLIWLSKLLYAKV